MNVKSDDFAIWIGKKANEYIQECISHTKEIVSSSGKVIEVRDRHIPTIEYFLQIWLPFFNLGTIVKSTYYEWLKGANGEVKSNAIKAVNDTFKALAKDIVANEGKGIFYAKNCLGMHDRQQLETKAVDKFEFDS